MHHQTEVTNGALPEPAREENTEQHLGGLLLNHNNDNDGNNNNGLTI